MILKQFVYKSEVSAFSPEDDISQEEVESMIAILNNEEATEDNLEQEEQEKKQNETTTSKQSTISNNKTSKNTYYIKVNYQANVVTIYTKDEDGEYTVPVKAMVCSTGSATPKSGTYTIKSRWEWLSLKGNVYGHYTTQIVGNILFHSVPYLRKWNPGSLEYWEYDKLRYNMLC